MSFTFIPDAIATTTSRPKAGEEEELRLVFKISISLLARLEISKLEVFSKICATNLNAYSDKSPEPIQVWQNFFPIEIIGLKRPSQQLTFRAGSEFGLIFFIRACPRACPRAFYPTLVLKNLKAQKCNKNNFCEKFFFQKFFHPKKIAW